VTRWTVDRRLLTGADIHLFDNIAGRVGNAVF